MRAVRVIQTSAIAMLLVAISLMLIASAHASERHDREEIADGVREALEYPHIHAKPEKHRHPRLHSEETRSDDSDYEPLYDDSDETDEEDDE